MLEQLGSSSEKYSEKEEKAKRRSDTVFDRVVNFLAPTSPQQVELFHRYATAHKLPLEFRPAGSLDLTLQRLRTAFQQTSSGPERRYLLGWHCNDAGGLWLVDCGL
jgi:hypothetical protein